MPQRGSSRIISIITVVEGGIGPQGPAGPTGNTGNYVTGPAGPTGLGISGFTYNSSIDGLTFYIEGSTAVYLTGFRGNTGNETTVAAPIFSSIGLGVSFVGSSGYTLFFRSITFSSGISASVSGDYIFIQENVGDTGSFDPDRLIFVNFSTPVYYLESSDVAKYKETVYSGNTYGNFEITQRTGRDLFGVENFNYSTGSAQNSAHYGLTMTIDSAFYGVSGTNVDIKLGSWNPYLRYRVNYYDLNGLSGATSGVVDFSPLGPYTKQIKFNVDLGSCCYCDGCTSQENDVVGRKCTDYVLKEYCESLNGRWNKSTCYQRQNSFDCYRRRACCINGRCINTSQDKCLQMGGTFCSKKECGLDYECGDPCIDTPPLVVKDCCCCKNGVGTDIQCTDLCEGGVILQGICSSHNCCNYDTQGACCVDGMCQQTTPEMCLSLSGIFRGAGVTCNPNPCCDPI